MMAQCMPQGGLQGHALLAQFVVSFRIRTFRRSLIVKGTKGSLQELYTNPLSNEMPTEIKIGMPRFVKLNTLMKSIYIGEVIVYPWGQESLPCTNFSGDVSSRFFLIRCLTGKRSLKCKGLVHTSCRSKAFICKINYETKSLEGKEWLK